MLLLGWQESFNQKPQKASLHWILGWYFCHQFAFFIEMQFFLQYWMYQPPKPVIVGLV
jgi:hypothetical protein